MGGVEKRRKTHSHRTIKHLSENAKKRKHHANGKVRNESCSHGNGTERAYQRKEWCLFWDFILVYFILLFFIILIIILLFSLASLSGLQVSFKSCVVFGTKEVRAWLVRVTLMIFFQSFVSMCKITCRYPAIFLIGPFVSRPSD